MGCPHFPRQHPSKKWEVVGTSTRFAPLSCNKSGQKFESSQKESNAGPKVAEVLTPCPRPEILQEQGGRTPVHVPVSHFGASTRAWVRVCERACVGVVAPLGERRCRGEVVPPPQKHLFEENRSVGNGRPAPTQLTQGIRPPNFADLLQDRAANRVVPITSKITSKSFL